MDKTAILEKVRNETHNIYKNAPHDLPFHGWHHIEFVRKNALRFCAELNADPFLVEIAAYVHDFNYVADINSGVEGGRNLRKNVLENCGLTQEVISQIEEIIKQGDINSKTSEISAEAKALSDGDTLFKVLPITPILFATLFMNEKHTQLNKMANRIVEIQEPLFEKDMYFYSDSAKKYMKWAKTNLELWQNVVEYLDDENLALGETGIPELDRYLSA